MQILNPDRTARSEFYGIVKPLSCGNAPGRTPVSVIVPCFNEEDGLEQLSEVFADLERMWPQYDWRFLFVDDCSTDKTSEVMQRQFAGQANCAVLRHHQNRGITGAILTGLDYANTEIVCSIDSDCTYDPRDLGRLVPMIEAGNDMITASPYHPQGGVAGVPAWRLVLSKAASTLYRLAFRAHVYTFTACYRAYRRSSVIHLDVQNPRYGGLAEMLLLLLIDGGRVGEFPTTLQVRRFGSSKMKVVRTIFAHLALMRKLLPVSWASGKPRATPIPAPAPAFAIHTPDDVRTQPTPSRKAA
jgi:glycosyltransferase involved in cell wall biosynthesis